MDKVCIVGGGTAGLVTALILKSRFSSLKVDVVKSDKIGIIGVGEGSTEHWKEFTDFTGITLKELITETDATFKYGVMFEDWTKKPYLHNVEADISSMRYGQYRGGYAYSIIKNLKPEKYTNGNCWKNEVSNTIQANQFHFNTIKLNKFLLKKCKEKNINIYEDEIVKVNVVKNNISSIESKNKKYKYDFYIDSTGFKKLLISKLGAKWQSYSDYLPMNEAIAFPTPDTKEYNAYTLAKAMSSGWMWRIPTQGRWGNGYVFNNRYINAEKAKKECEKYLGYKIEIGKNIKFEAGALDKAWIGNCVATGLSSSFIEPLEASSIGTSIQQAFLLMHSIINYSQSDIDLYNEEFKYIVENIRDFVLLHYMVNKKDSKFWKELKINLTDTLKHNLNKWKNRLPIDNDFPGHYHLFNAQNFIIVMKELNLINKSLIKKEYDTLSKVYRDDIETKVKNVISFYKELYTISHKQYLKSYYD